MNFIFASIKKVVLKINTTNYTITITQITRKLYLHNLGLPIKPPYTKTKTKLTMSTTLHL